MARVSALAEHREPTAAATRDGRCYRTGCLSSVAVRFIDPALFVDSACTVHGRELWRGRGGGRAEAAGRFAVARVGGDA